MSRKYLDYLYARLHEVQSFPASHEKDLLVAHISVSIDKYIETHAAIEAEKVMG